MSTSFQAKQDKVLGRQLKVQTLCIPFTIVGSATAANVVATSDEPALMFFNTEGVTGISTATGALNSGDTATYAVAPNDANGTFNVLVKIDEVVEKVCTYRCVRRATALASADDAMVVALGSTAAVVQNGGTNGTKIMLTVDGELSLAAANTLDACLEVSYVVAE
jgi:hypothetical protein